MHLRLAALENPDNPNLMARDHLFHSKKGGQRLFLFLVVNLKNHKLNLIIFRET